MQRVASVLVPFALALVLALPAAAITPMRLRTLIYRSDPCLAHIVDVEGGRWQATESYGGSYGNTAESYGLPQADPGTKMAHWSYTVGREHAGAPTPGDWATNPWTQLAWATNYAIGRYGSVCAAWDAREANGYW
jgi:hypothetical protein